ncbi:PQQ-binding-like beta-propeller repeat protein [Nocardiopsis sp. RSe5-2]|uniref:PQQ-binding-like beta-propeller repeat protein n=1 Tax=Nocardiopsis endophytica TaxID=3018445 RepID=A0ABT4UE12_9ACTN|nr:PQQ-binding-like beta-propeller repeat protein [Nocardiopsis endophytica]MDA2815237.1 PQQ-binding-like beta-propeller repeat protein [Nocardiopsis endophytica]
MSPRFRRKPRGRRGKRDAWDDAADFARWAAESRDRPDAPVDQVERDEWGVPLDRSQERTTLLRSDLPGWLRVWMRGPRGSDARRVLHWRNLLFLPTALLFSVMLVAVLVAWRIERWADPVAEIGTGAVEFSGVAWQSEDDTRVEAREGAVAVRGLKGWATDDGVVRADHRGLTAYAAEDGAPMWRYEPAPDEICAVDQGVGQGQAPGVVVLLLALEEDEVDHPDGDGAPVRSCDTAVAVDLSDGRELWRTGVDRDPEGIVTVAGVWTVGDLVLVRWGERLSAMDAATGERVWSAPGAGGSEEDMCTLGSVRARPGEGDLVGWVTCLEDGVSPYLVVLDPADGSETTRVEAPAEYSGGTHDYRVVSVDPIVVAVDGLLHDDIGRHLLVVDPDTGRTRRIDGEGGAFSVMSGPWRIDVAGAGVLAEGGTAFAATDVRDDANRVVAFDTATGEQAWSAHLPADTRVRPVALDGGRILALGAETDPSTGDREHGDGPEPESEEPVTHGPVMAFDTATGAVTRISGDIGHGVDIGGDEPETVWDGETIYVLPEPVLTSEDGEPSPAVIAIR